MNKGAEFMADSIDAISVFDVCDTLYCQNTTFGFIRFLMRGNWKFYVFDMIASARWSPIFLLFALLGKLTGRDYIRNIYLRYLRGKSKSELDAVSELYLAEVLKPLAVPLTHVALTEALRKNRTVCLCSASIDCVVGAIARSFETLYRSSTLEYVDGICTGKLAHDITGRKHEIIRGIPGFVSGVTILHVFTDNLSDMELVKISNHATVILPGGRGREHWVECKVKFLNV